MNSVKRLKGRRPPLGTQAHTVWKEKQQGYRFRAAKGRGIIKEVWDHQKQVWTVPREPRLIKNKPIDGTLQFETIKE